MKFPISDNKFPKVVLIGIAGFYIILFVWLFDRHFAPRGVWSTEQLISAPFPQERMEKTSEGYRVKETPVYFEVDNPRKFDRAELTVRFRGEAPIIEAGVVKSEDPWRVEMRTLYHQYLEELDWPRIEGDGLILLQRESRYNTIQEFIENPPAIGGVAVVDVSLPSVILRSEATKESRGKRTGSLDSPSTSSGSLGMTNKVRYDVSLRGPQSIYLTHGGGVFEVRFFAQDMNRHDEPDHVAATLTDTSGHEYARAELTDDGIEWNSHKPSVLRELNVVARDLMSGIYRLTVAASDDIFIRRIISSSSKIVWKGQLYLGDEVQYRPVRGALTVYSNGQEFALRTPHPESVQTVEFASTEALPPESRRQGLELTEHNKQYTIQMPRDVAGNVLAVIAPKRDVVLITDGFFALSRDAFFLPEPIAYRSDLDLERLGINYVLARYTPSNVKHGWRESTVTVGTWDANPPSPLRVVLSTPLGASQDFEVSDLRVKLAKPRLTRGRIVDKITELWAKLR